MIYRQGNTGRTSGENHTTRILIVDDHDIVRAGVRSLLESYPRYKVVAEASDGIEAIARAIDVKPNVVVLDYMLPQSNGLEVARQLRVELPRSEILMFTMHYTDQSITEALRAGVRGYLLKSDGCRELVEAINSVAAHRPYFSGYVADILLRSRRGLPNQPDSTLSNREREVVQLVAEGNSNKEIAKALSIGLVTVENHRASAIRKLHLSSSAGLVRYAVRNKLVEA
jgi:DNA-binding NarL/FixJ family response regulator